MFARIAFNFVFEPIARSAATGTGRIAALDHEIGNYAMKHGAVIKSLAGEKDEVVHRFRGVLGEEVAYDFSP